MTYDGLRYNSRSNVQNSTLGAFSEAQKNGSIFFNFKDIDKPLNQRVLEQKRTLKFQGFGLNRLRKKVHHF